MSKRVLVTGHRFDSLPGHVAATGVAEGSTLRSALCAAVRKMLAAPQLKRRRIGSFTLSVTVLDERKDSETLQDAGEQRGRGARAGADHDAA